jgi:hypothetical protein
LYFLFSYLLFGKIEATAFKMLVKLTTAWEFIDDHLGVDYGWEVVLTGFLVTILPTLFIVTWKQSCPKYD